MAITDITTLFTQGYGWVLTFLLVAYELYAPRFLNHNTALAPIVRDVPERVSHLESQTEDIVDKTDKMHQHVSEIDKLQRHHVQATRANTRALDPQTDVTVDADEIDAYLVDNGIPVSQLTADLPSDADSPDDNQIDLSMSDIDEQYTQTDADTGDER